MDFPTRTCFAGRSSDDPGHRGPVNLGTEGLDDAVQVAFTEDVDRAWRTDRESFPGAPAAPEHRGPAGARRMSAAPCTNRLEGVSA